MNLDALPESLDPAQVVEAYDQAWREGNYDAFLALTVLALRQDLGVGAGEAFEAVAAEYQESSQGLTMAVTGVDVDGDSAVVTTTETSIEGTDHVVEKVRHQLMRIEGAWQVASVEAADV